MAPKALLEFVTAEDDQIHPEAAVAPGYLANHAARVFNRLVDNALRAHGLSLALIGPILLLSWKGPMRQRDLVAASAIRQPAMVAMLDKLQAMGLVTRAPDPADRRAAIVSLTAAGQAAAAVGGDALRAANRDGLAGLTAAESATLVTLLQRFIDRLEAGTEHHQ